MIAEVSNELCLEIFGDKGYATVIYLLLTYCWNDALAYANTM